MSYNRQTWVNGPGGGTPRSAARFNWQEAGIQEASDRADRLELGVAAAVGVDYAPSLALNAQEGALYRVVATGDLALNDITGGVDGQEITLEVRAAGGDRVLTIAGQDPVTILAGSWWVGRFRFNEDTDTWLLTTNGVGGEGAVESVNGQTGVVVLDADDLTDGTTNHVFTAVDDGKLTGIAAGATANSPDAALRDRSTHTGVQPISTITGLQTALDDAVSGMARVVEAPLSLTDPRVAAVLDGTGDQASKIATAIGLLPTAGGHIYQPPGILRTSAVSFTRPVRWEGAGEGASTIKAASGFTGTLLTVSATAPFSEISNVTVDGAGSAVKGLLVASPRGKFHHLHFTAFAGATGAAMHFNGVDTTNSSHANQMSNIRIVACGGYGVHLQGFAYDNEFTNLWIGTCQVGIRVENTDCFFSNLHVWGSTGSGVELRNANTRMSNVYIETNGLHGIDCFNAPHTKITGGSIWKNQGQGVNVSTSDRVSMIGLNIYDQGSNGVNGSNSLHGKVIGCDFYDDTTSTQTQDRPIATTGTSDQWIITGNTMLTAEHSTGGVSLVGSSNIVTDNITGPTTSTRTGSYTLVAADAGTEQVYNSASAGTFTVPTDAAAAIAIGTSIPLRQIGVGQLIVAAASGVAVQSRGGALSLAGQYAVGELRKTGANAWVLYGDVTS